MLSAHTQPVQADAQTHTRAHDAGLRIKSTQDQRGRGPNFARKNNIYQIWSFLRASYLRDLIILALIGTTDTDLFNPLVPKAHNSDCQNILFPLQIEPARLLKLIGGFFSGTFGTNRLSINTRR